jgi:hypothetical protein
MFWRAMMAYQNFGGTARAASLRWRPPQRPCSEISFAATCLVASVPPMVRRSRSSLLRIKRLNQLSEACTRMFTSCIAEQLVVGSRAGISLHGGGITTPGLHRAPQPIQRVALRGYTVGHGDGCAATAKIWNRGTQSVWLGRAATTSFAIVRC